MFFKGRDMEKTGYNSQPNITVLLNLPFDSKVIEV